MIWQPIPPLLLPLFLVRLALPQTACQFQIVVNRFDALGGDRELFFKQEILQNQHEIFKELLDSPIDTEDRNAHYLGFPYYLKVNLSCAGQDSARAIRKAHYTGLIPIVAVAFEEPVHTVRQKPEQLQISMKAAPYRISGNCDSELCQMCWYTPMPIMNGSVVMAVTVKSNNLGFLVNTKRAFVNINGYVKETNSGHEFSIGEQGCFHTSYLPAEHRVKDTEGSVFSGEIMPGRRDFAQNSRITVSSWCDFAQEDAVFQVFCMMFCRQLTSLKDYVSLRDESRPLWHTFKQAPVLILGGFPKHKMVIISDTGFDDFFPIEVAIDSCWISSPKCPWEEFSSSIFDAIATESTLFIRQNQLIYYFTGNYTALYMNTSGSELWTRILTKHCVRKLNPVAFPKNNTEFVIALGGGSQEGKFFLITVSDGIVKHAASSKKSACSVLGTPCELMWTVFDTESNKFFLLIHTKLEGNVSSYYIMAYYRATEHYEVLSFVPKFLPDSKDQGFVVMIGQEQYTDIPMVPRGISYNPFSLIFYIWGNMILQSNDLKNYLYLSNFRSDSSIKYFVQSYMGPYACVTDDEQVWISHEGSSIIRKIYPTRAYTMYRSLQLMSGSKRFGLQESLVSLFYEKFQLRELVYIEDALGNGKLFKRATPLRYILTYNHIIENPQRLYPYNGKDYIKFSHTCPFGRVNIVELPPPQRYTREEYYRTEPPDIMEKTGFHDKKSLTVYQGLIFQLLWLHSAYNRPYADPVHDPTWRWWKNKAENMQYYSYVASNRNSSGGIYVNMNNYVKVYRVKASNLLPDTIYLDKNSAYNFSVFFNIRTKRESLGETPEENSLNLVWLTLIVTHPEYLNVLLDRRELISRGSVIYKVTVMDAGVYPRQDLSGKKLLQTSMIFSVVNAVTRCYGYIDNGPVVKGYRVLPVVVGCPPGRRLAFDITGTLQYTTRKNKHYFDCVNPDPEMPCFFFNDVFYPLFLIQDMVTGDSGPFQGSYIFKIIGGGPYSTENIRYFSEEEILLYNTNNNSEVTGHIWLREDTTDTIMNDEGFHILSGTDSGILWVCQERSPCYDILPRDMLAPDYFFVVKVTNRGVDQTTYCDYALEFIIHVHGLRLSPTRAIFLMKVSMGSVAGLVVLYMVAYVLGPKVRSVCSRVARRIEEVVILRTGSSITFSSSATSRSSHNFPNLSDVSTIASFPSHTYAHAHAQGK